MRYLLWGLLHLVALAGYAEAQHWTVIGGPRGGNVTLLERVEGGALYAAVGVAEPYLYRSSGDGATWQPLPSVTSPAYAVAATPDGTVYAGTRDGLWHATDGETWESVAGATQSVFALTATPQGVLLAGTEDGIYRLTEHDEWSRVAVPGTEVVDFSVGPSGQVAAAADRTVLHSTDGGATWEVLTTLPGSVSGLTFHPDGDLYMAVQVDRPGDVQGLFRRSRSGGSPAPVATPIADAWPVWLFVDPAGQIYVSFFAEGSYRSDDAGATWQHLGLAPLTVTDGVVLADGTFCAGLVGVLLPPLVGSPGVVCRSPNDEGWAERNDGMPFATIARMATGRDGTILVHTGHAVYYSSDQGASWRPVFRVGFNSGPVALLPDGSALVLTSDGRLHRSAPGFQQWTAIDVPFAGMDVHLLVTESGTLLARTASQLYRSSDRGDTWSVVQGGLPTGATDVGDVVAGPGATIFARVDDTIYRSADDGVTWTPLPVDGLGGSEIAVATSTLLYVSEGETVSQVTRDATGWEVRPFATAPGWISQLVADRAGTVYAAVADNDVARLVRIESGSGHVEPFAAGLPDDVVQTLDLASDGYLYAGMFLGGVYRSTQPAPTATAPPPETVVRASLGAAYPNPFRQHTTIPVTLSAPAHVTLSLYDLLGRKVGMPVSKRLLPAGTHDVTWQAAGQGAGVYLVKLIVGGRVETQQIVRLN